MPEAIKKSRGITSTENFLSSLCEDTFLGIWSYPNPFKADGKEACDLIAVFENHVFLFFDRESRKFDDAEKDVLIQWKRWEKEVIQKQIQTARGVKKYILNNPDKLYLDPKQEVPFPISISKEDIKIHCIIVAHGASEACKKFSKENIYGSLAIVYGGKAPEDVTMPFMVHLDKDDPVHIFDSHNLEIILSELDTFYDFSRYVLAKEKAIQKYNFLTYCGEEDLLAHYFLNFNESEKVHFIGTEKKDVNAIVVGEGGWHNFIQSKAYKRKKSADKASYLWDGLLQRTCTNALAGTLTGNGNVFTGESAICEMAKEPRFMRRALSENIDNAINDYPFPKDKCSRKMTFMHSFYKGVAYVFLQVHHPNITNYENEHRPRRQAILKIACGATKNRFPHLNKIIGIAIDAPKFTKSNSEDFLLLNCEKWSDENKQCYEKLNKDWNFFKTGVMRTRMNAMEFPDGSSVKTKKIGRNDICPCGSNKKYKKCCFAV